MRAVRCPPELSAHARTVEAGTFPSFRAEGDEHGEETRLLYVAMTRAQSSLYLTHVNARMTGYGSSGASLRPLSR